MKKKFIQAITLFSIITMMSCKKNQIDQVSESKLDNAVKVAISKWVETQKQNSNSADTSDMNSLLKLCDWNTASVRYKSSGIEFVYIPIVSENKNLGLQVFYNATKNDVDSMDIILITSLSENRTTV